MNRALPKLPKSTSLPYALAVAAGLFASAVSGHAQSVIATISDTPASGGFDYTIILQNTGSTDINSFWYGWTQGGNNLPSDPSNLGNTVGWGQSLFGGNSVEWVNSSGTALAPGDSGTFTFFSSSTPAEMTAPPAGESVAYVNGIDFSQGTPGDSTGVFSPTLVAAPEPSAMALVSVGSIGLLASGWRRFRAR